MSEKRTPTLRKAVTLDVPEIAGLMQDVSMHLEDQTLFVCDDPEFVRLHVEKQGFGVVACAEDGTIIGSLLLRYPGLEEDNLGRDIGIEESELTKVVHMESAVVAEAYRGNGLQSRMIQYAEELLDIDRFSYLCATVSPNNPASFRTLERNGYRHVMTKKKYQGYLRRIYLKEI